ncbi:hypothetical protein NDU88_001482 [Pleurodeles waltl]|uniref:Uncharacterized protein n=1 Tax=Pleurodeles waltl TaxID=8319 RepID=A0AAV7NAY7_PLEWA|nr:hypothetical protein NDU88_001482 [Pleurodeles waltl]
MPTRSIVGGAGASDETSTPPALLVRGWLFWGRRPLGELPPGPRPALPQEAVKLGALERCTSKCRNGGSVHKRVRFLPEYLKCSWCLWKILRLEMYGRLNGNPFWLLETDA